MKEDRVNFYINSFNCFLNNIFDGVNEDLKTAYKISLIAVLGFLLILFAHLVLYFFVFLFIILNH